MRSILKLLACLMAAVTLIWWVVAGAHAGWTKTSVPVTFVDEITGIEGITYEDRFIPGVDFLGAGLMAAGVVFGAAMVPARRVKKRRIES